MAFNEAEYEFLEAFAENFLLEGSEKKRRGG